MLISLVSSIERVVLTTEMRLTRISRMMSVVENISAAPKLLSSDLDIAGDTFATEIDVLIIKSPVLYVLLQFTLYTEPGMYAIEIHMLNSIACLQVMC
jgi:hypothetical protein